MNQETGQIYAHDVVYSGSEEQLIQFAEALIAARYTDPDPELTLKEQAEGNKSVSTFGNGRFAFYHRAIVFGDDIVFPSHKLAQAIEMATKLAL